MGSEMCIRDRPHRPARGEQFRPRHCAPLAKQRRRNSLAGREPVPVRELHLALCRKWVAGEVEAIEVLGEELSVLAPDAFALSLEEEGKAANKL